MKFTQVYEIVARIPPGKVLSYGRIAMMLGRPLAARAVAMALRDTPADCVIPAHRVVNKEGAMAPGDIFGGALRQRALLESEGVLFLDNGKIDMSRSMWEL